MVDLLIDSARLDDRQRSATAPRPLPASQPRPSTELNMRKNGWETRTSRLFHVLHTAHASTDRQVFPAVMALFFAFYTPILDRTPAIILSVVYAAACLVTVASVAMCTGTDPSDDCITRPSTMADARDSRPDNRVYCNVCMKYVNNQSRHCRLCDKCVDVFDHHCKNNRSALSSSAINDGGTQHCKWLNNCVGKKNYRFFLGSVVGASVFLAIQIAVGIYLVVELYTNEDDVMGNSATSYGCSTQKDDTTGFCVDEQYSVSLQTLRIIHIVLLAFLSPWLFMIGQLALFHFHLCMENITTYDYIVRQRKRKNAQDRQNTVRVPWWKKCCGERPASGPESDNSKPSVNQTSDSRVSAESVRKSEEEELAEIEAEVDESLEVLSNQSGEIRERDSSHRGSSLYRKRRSSSGPKRGFGLHVDLAGQRSVQANADKAETRATWLLRTPLDFSTGGPASPLSPRSDAGSAYFSSSQVDEIETRDTDEATNQPLPAYKVSDNSSMVMYGRPPIDDSPSDSHIV
ncbi:putative palmitoyltransferase ZDHHC11 [Phytophthora citrophthora]|uniref:Palmitoyltransferase n=1 Tax=Phytophthora citrophthora TaxID=4793 RepID=A0AAD9FYT2_9STRA|nr:putative palmitoyltransferase ZDHHC11 [Phytophthora citrophthora]